MILLFGAPRSGTSWLAKIFDSHPDVLYRHEPDSERKHADIPFLCSAAEAEALMPVAAGYLRGLVRVRTLKAAGSLPAFPKSYYGPLRAGLRRSWIYGARLTEKLCGRHSWITVPDFFDPARRPSVRFAMKSVDSMGRLNLFTRAVPEARSVVVVRHPCGQVASVIRGMEKGFLASAAIVSMARMEQARRRGLGEDLLRALPREQQLAWNWALLNEKALEDVDGNPNVLVVRYEDLCSEPVAMARRMFDFAGLRWHEQTERFLDVSSTYRGSERYFQVVRNSRRAAEKWKEQLSAGQVEQILEVAARTRPGRLYLEREAVAGG
jgi:hypothetical protein